MDILQFATGDLLHLKKPHPCGSTTMQVLRVGSDVRIRCTLCGRDFVLSRVCLEKSIRRVEHVKEGATQ